MTEPKRITLRTDENFHARIQKVAKEKKRSIHSQVLVMLEAYFDENMLRQRLDELRQQSN